jgi:hypothetical protein
MLIDWDQQLSLSSRLLMIYMMAPRFQRSKRTSESLFKFLIFQTPKASQMAKLTFRSRVHVLVGRDTK